MATEKRIYSDLAIAPGEYLAEVLEAKGMAQADLARRVGRPVQAVNEIIKGQKAITPETAIQLERALDVPAHIWTGLESRYQLVKARLEEKKRLKREAALVPCVPYKQLADLGCVEKTRDSELKVRELQRFYGVSSLANVPGIKAYEASFRIGGGREASGYALTAWIRCAELRAAEVRTDAFDRKKLRGALAEIRGLSRRNPGAFVPKLERVLAGCGIAFILLPHFPKTYAHGATFWPVPGKAVLLMSIRGRWEDAFWFSLFHEIGHLLMHGKRTFIDDKKAPLELLGKEKEADEFAANSLIPTERLEEFVRGRQFGERSVRDFADEVGVSPAIVVGRLQHEGLLGYGSELNKLRIKFDWGS